MLPSCGIIFTFPSTYYAGTTQYYLVIALLMHFKNIMSITAIFTNVTTNDLDYFSANKYIER